MGEVNLYNPHDGLTGRDGGPYLDQEERRLAEVRRAAIEGREPDFDNAPAVAGTPLVTAGQLVNMANPTSNPSQTSYDPSSDAVDKLAKDESFPVNPVSTREVTPEEEAQATAEENADDHVNNPANPTTVSKDPEFVDDTQEFDEDADDEDILDALTGPDESK